MPYVPNTDSDRKDMLREIGASSIEELLADVPPELRFRGEIDVPGPLSELELSSHLEKLASMNRRQGDVVSFLGGGVYDHSIPAVVRHITGMPQFYTAYTPYQPEVSQGTLQAIYEFQSFMSKLTGMEVANASMYDGATAAAEAMLMALAATRTNKIVMSSTVNPATRAVVRTYLSATGAEIVELPDEGGVTDLGALRSTLDGAGAVLVQNPNFFGLLEPVDQIGAALEESKALLTVSVDPISLALVKPPSEYGADIVVGEGQCLGSPPGYGGPLLGFMATTRKHMRRMPGRIIGATADSEGRRGYVMTLQTREQHIRREKATSNICTNQGLVALAATVYLSLLGESGLRELATQILSKARYAAEQISAVPGVELRFDGRFFREFVVRLPIEAARMKERLAEVGIWPGVKCGCFYGGMDDCLLVSVTERHSRADIDSLASAIAAVLTAGGGR